MIHHPHIPHRQHAHQQGIAEHHDTPAEALLHGVQIVGKEAHEVAHFVDLIVFPAQILGMVKHPVAQILFQSHRTSKEAEAPHKPAENHGQNDHDHLHADFIQHEVHVKRQLHTIHRHIAHVHAIDDDSIKFRNFQLQKIHQHQRGKARQQPARILQIIAIDMFSEYHTAVSFPKVIFWPHYSISDAIYQSIGS